ncbi:MAG: phospholipase D-like domain-containing protein, partial [Candidatus Thermoplasmatota archaeon]|nr:phospholipase D-like domain-containing protein [Candidatus Thermoplasmatota archaeon]
CIEESAGTDPRAVAYQAGNRVADVEVPGGGWRVREPGRGPWVPWVLPEGVLPAPVDPIHVEGWARPLATQENGLATVLELIAGARHRLTVATYMLTHPEIAEALIQAAQRGVEVRLFIEPEPIGGAPPGQRGLVAALLQAGVGVIEARGPWSATGVQHGKVVVADGHRCLVLTENLTRSGLPDPGRRGNLGFALAIANATLARELEARYGVHGPSHPGGIPTTWHPFAARVGIVTAPENAWSQAVVPRLLEEADGPVWGASLTTHPAWQDRSNPWLRALVNASDHVPVRVLLDGGGSHGPSSGTRLTLGHLARDPGAADLQVRLSGPAGKVHAKVLVTPGAVLVGSSNWNQGGALWNREVNLLVEDPSLAAWYAHALEEAFEEAGGAPEHLRVPGPSAGLVALGPCLAGWRLRRGPGLRPGS